MPRAAHRMANWTMFPHLASASTAKRTTAIAVSRSTRWPGGTRVPGLDVRGGGSCHNGADLKPIAFFDATTGGFCWDLLVGGSESADLGTTMRRKRLDGRCEPWA